MRFILVLFLGFLSLSHSSTAQRIGGTIKDEKTGEALPNVSIFIDNIAVGFSNSYGFFSIKLKPKSEKIKFNLVGYKPYVMPVKKEDSLINIYLQSTITNLDAVEVSTQKSNIKKLQTSSFTLSQEVIKAIPSLTGTPDILKVFQLIPGVQTANEGTTNLNVRGGSYDQNLILLDEAPIYNPSHVLGFFSTFNADAIKSATIYKGNFPAQYGGRLSSVIDIVMKEGNNKKFTGEVSIGLTANQITLQGPFKKNKTSFLISFRNSNVSNLLKVINFVFPANSAISNDEHINFWDNNIKINHIFNNKNKIYFSFYASNDNYKFKIFSLLNDLAWSNYSGTIRWNHIFSSSLFSNLSLYSTQYSSINKNQVTTQNYEWVSGIKETGLKQDFTKYQQSNNQLKFGYAFIYRNFNPGNIVIKDTSINNKNPNVNRISSFEISAYISKEQNINDKFSIQYGVRTSWFADLGPSLNNAFINASFGNIRGNFFSFEPRLSARYLLNDFSSLKSSLSFSQQNLHLVGNSSAGLPYDYWIPASKVIKPQRSIQFSVGYFADLFNKKLALSVEAYYKSLDNILDFKDNVNLITEPNIELVIAQGIGRSYGLEVLIEKNIGKFTGWISYTLARTQYKLPSVNNNNWYSPRYDIRHNLAIVSLYKISPKTDFSATFKLTSGGFICLPTQLGYFDGITIPIYGTTKNNYQLPAYNRLDVSFKFRGRRYNTKKLKTEFVVTIYNVYASENIFSLLYRPYISPDKRSENNNFAIYDYSQLYKYYLFSIVPTVNLNIKF
ncbi:MAG: TonB-dependent receptor [Alphaproteobacteria bacterium]|nr:TonB-dependent receptor [Alphaproteobacteria bacterium]